jgi:hypothetical protein
MIDDQTQKAYEEFRDAVNEFKSRPTWHYILMPWKLYIANKKCNESFFRLAVLLDMKAANGDWRN